MNWKNIRIHGKLTITASVIIIFTLIVGIVSITNLTSINRNIRIQANNYVPIVNTTFNNDKAWHEIVYLVSEFKTQGTEYQNQQIKSKLAAVTEGLGQILSNSNITELSKSNIEKINLINTKVKEFKTLYTEYEIDVKNTIKHKIEIDSLCTVLMLNQGKDFHIKSIILEIETLITKFSETRNVRHIDELDKILIYSSVSQNEKSLSTLVSLVKSFKTEFKSTCLLELKIREYSKEVMGEMKNVSDSVLNAFTENSEITNKIASNAIKIVVLAIILCVLLSAIFTNILSKSIRQPIAESVSFAKELANGNLSIILKTDRKDEAGELISSLGNMSDILKNMINKIKDAANQIADAGTKLSSSAQQLANGATEQASSTEEVAASMEEISSTIQLVVENAKNTRTISRNASARIEEGTNSAKAAILSMKQIAAKVSIINDIAFQTNLLALNAAVEAARAGNSGKGFSVVASEVRKLAEHSKNAAIEIEKVSTETVKISSVAGEKLENVMPEIIKTADLVNEITESSLEQSNGVNQINSAITQLNNVTQENVSSSEQVASSSEELLAQAEYLKNIISFFNT